MAEKKWIGGVPAECDICKDDIVDAFYDAKSRMGVWGNMCPLCFNRVGLGLGTGLGQKYEKQADGRWLKTGG